MGSIIKARGSRAGVPVPVFQPASEAQKDVFLRHYALNRHVGEACRAAGIGRGLYNHALASDPAFVEKVKEADEFFLDKLEDVANTMACQRSDGPMIRWILERHRPEKYAPRGKMDVTHRFAGPEDVRKLSDEELVVACESLGIRID